MGGERSFLLSKYIIFDTQRIIDSNGWSHNHAFLHVPTLTRLGTAKLERSKDTILGAGIRDLRVLKTTKSSFEVC